MIVGFIYDDVSSKDMGVKARLTSWQVSGTLRNYSAAIPGKYGVADFGADMDAREIPVSCSIFPKLRFSDLVETLDGIALWLSPVNGLKQLIFDDVPDRYFMARLKDKVDLFAQLEIESEHIKEQEGRKLNIDRIVSIFGFSSSSYYDYLARQKQGPTDSEMKRQMIKARILAIHLESHEIYGAPKITHILRSEGYNVSEKTTGNYMREMGLKAHYIKPYTITTISSSFDDKLKNILARDFNPEQPNAYWCSDITYIWTEEDGFVYLTSVMDLFSRKIIAWEISKTLDAESVLRSIDVAVARRKGIKPRIFHTDRGVQFVSYLYYKKLGSEVTTSYSRPANPWDNACIESFHALIKRESLNRHKIKNLAHARSLVFQYIDTFYNTTRIHSHCDYMSPNDYEAKYFRELEDKIKHIEVKQVNHNIAC
jgi:putative transposase